MGEHAPSAATRAVGRLSESPFIAQLGESRLANVSGAPELRAAAFAEARR